MKRTVKLALFVGLIGSIWLPGQGQINNTIYHMSGIPQSNRVNPAFQPQSNLYIGFPLISQLRAEAVSNSLDYSDVIYPHPFEDSLITFLHPLGDKEEFLNKLEPLNYLSTDIRATLISAGFRTPVGFFSLDLSTRTDESFHYSSDLVRLFIKGAQEGETYDLSGTGINATAFDEVSVGWSYHLFDNLQVGARARLLFGIADLSTESPELTLRTSRDAWDMDADMTVNASLPFAEVLYDEDGMIEDILVTDDLNQFDLFVLNRYLFNLRNPGFGIDLGISYRPIMPLQVSASVLDLGFISWGDEVHRAEYQGNYSFEGIELNPFDLPEDLSLGDYLDSTFSQIGDTLSGFLEFSPGGNYRGRLNTKIYVGASYDVTPYFNVGLLSRTDLLQGSIAQRFTASANIRAGRIVHFSASYSTIGTRLHNIGTGISFNFGPVNLYMVSDNALSVLLMPQETYAANIWFGLNLVFGYKNYSRPGYGDRPMIY